MTTSIVIDTNLLLDDPKIIYKLSTKYDQIIIPIIVMKELDKLKRQPDLSYSARGAITEILQFKHLYPNKLLLYVDKQGIDHDSNDLKIIQSAVNNNAELGTKDVSMSIIAETMNVTTKLYGTVSNGLFDPYIEVALNKIDNNFTFAQEYNNEITLGDIKVSYDQWQFIFIKNEDEVVYIYATNPLNRIIERIDNISQYRNIKTDGGLIKALDAYQICGIYGLKNAPCVVLTGKYGSGKNLLSTAYAVSECNSKVFITRPPIGISSKYDIGFTPGFKEDKLFDWLAGFVSSLYYIYSNSKSQSSNKDSFVAYDYVKEKIFKEKFECISINSIQGLSILEGDFFIADEVQLLTVDVMSMLLSRANKNSKLILLGDLMQTYSVVKSSESGLLKLRQLLPDPSICYINLKASYRSNLTQIADKLQDKTI